jgi:TetR/AcrR family transcriptional regulator, regulator of mycofactocin system
MRSSTSTSVVVDAVAAAVGSSIGASRLRTGGVRLGVGDLIGTEGHNQEVLLTFVAMTIAARTGAGRPQATSHAAIEDAAFRLFQLRGFDETTVDDIAAAVGIGRRTLFRYFPSKNDIPWGRFDDGLSGLRATLAAIPDDVPVLDAVHQSVMEFNRLDDSATEQHRQRMTLLLTTPALQAHSVLRYAQWREVIAEYAASRYGLEPDDLLPRTIGHVSLALSLSAYEQWLREPESRLTDLLAQTAPLLRSYVDGAAAARPARRQRGSRGAVVRP